MDTNTMSQPIFPCYSDSGRKKNTMLLHLATYCNTQCNFCFRSQIAGLSAGMNRMDSAIMTPESAIDLVSIKVESGNPPASVEIGGPGEPLLFASTYAVLRALRNRYPDIELSVWTNGLLLADRLEELVRSGIKHLTVSVNAAIPETAAQIYNGLIYRVRKYSAEDSAALLLHRQWGGIKNAVEAGVFVTIYSMIIEGVNDNDLPLVASRARELGVDHMICSRPIQRSQ